MASPHLSGKGSGHDAPERKRDGAIVFCGGRFTLLRGREVQGEALK